MLDLDSPCFAFAKIGTYIDLQLGCPRLEIPGSVSGAEDGRALWLWRVWLHQESSSFMPSTLMLESCTRPSVPVDFLYIMWGAGVIWGGCCHELRTIPQELGVFCRNIWPAWLQGQNNKDARSAVVRWLRDVSWVWWSLLKQNGFTCSTHSWYLPSSGCETAFL